MDDDIIPINQLPDDDVIPIHQLKNDSSETFLQKAIRDVGILGTHAANTGTAGLYEQAGVLGSNLGNRMAGLEKNPAFANRNYAMVEPRTDPGQGIGGFLNMIMNPGQYHENISEGVGNIGGFVAGAPGKVYKGAEALGSKLVPNYLGKVLGRAAGGAASGAMTPGNLEERTGAAKLGAVLAPTLSAPFDAVKAVKNLTDITGARKTLSGTIRKGAESAEQQLENLSKKANVEMGNSLQQLKNTGMNVTHLDDMLNKTAFEIDPSGSTHEVPGSMANQVLNLKSGIKGNPSKMSGPELQARFVDLKDKLGMIGSKAQGAFNTIFKESVPKNFRSIQETRGKVYNIEELAKPLTKSATLNKVAKGTIDEELLSQLKSAEKQVPGLKVLEDIIKSGKKVKNVQMARKLAKYLVGGSATMAGVPILKNVLSGD